MSLYLEDVLDFIESFDLVEEGHIYMGKLDAKKEKSIGIYHLKQNGGYKSAIGGMENRSYATKSISFLVHWNKSPRDTENAAIALFERLEGVRDAIVNDNKIYFIRPLTNEPVDVGTDEAGIYEMVIETEFFYKKE